LILAKVVIIKTIG